MKNLLDLYKLPTVWGGHILGILIAIFSPVTILSDSQIIYSACDGINKLIPSISGYVENSNFPQVTSFYFCALSLMGILLCIELRNRPDLMINDGISAIRRMGPFPFLYPVLGTIFTLGLFWFSLVIGAGRPWNLLPIHSSRFALALVGPIFAWAPFIIFSFFLAIIKTWHLYQSNSVGK